MKSQTRTIILLHFLQNQEDLSYNSSLMKELKRVFGASSTIFSLDSLSDSITVHYAIRLFDESDNVLIVCDVINGDKLGAGQSLLNHAIRKKDKVRLFTNSDTKYLQPFMKFLKGKVFENINELTFEAD